MAAKTQTEGSRVSRRELILWTVGGVLLASAAAVVAVRRLFQKDVKGPTAHRTVQYKPDGPFEYPSEPRKAERKPLLLSFTGPFSYHKGVIKKAVGNSWIEVSSISFSDSGGDDDMLYVVYRAAEQAPPFKMHSLITVTTRDGIAHTLWDEMQWSPMDPRMTPVLGADVAESAALVLPGKLSEVVKLDIQYVPKETS